MTKFIFITGGVCSSLGKGVVAASTGALLEARNLSISLTKVDPYLNVDPGTMNPQQHGEVFVTEDGAETDLDLGHYERFTSIQLSKKNSFSTGQIYKSVLENEREGSYLGNTVQVVPHVTDKIKEFILNASKDVDVSIVELGGTVGDIEAQPFLEAIRQLRYEYGSDAINVHLTLLPYLEAAKEYKTKPTQHSVKLLQQAGLQPNIIMCRSEGQVPKEKLVKIGRFCNTKHVLRVADLKSIYQVPLYLYRQNYTNILEKELGLGEATYNMTEWDRIDRVFNPRAWLPHGLPHGLPYKKIGIVGKYTDVEDSYKSIHEALMHASIATDTQLQIRYIEAEEVEKTTAWLENLDAVIVPGGFGDRGIEGKISTIKYCRENKVPFLGICLGMQLACVEFARNVLGIQDATSEEYGNGGKIIHFTDGQTQYLSKGGTMRLGSYPCHLRPQSKILSIYNTSQIKERHRHRYEFNLDYAEQFEVAGMQLSGLSPDNQLVEVIELSDHPWFVGCQFHPELKSKPFECHPLFKSLIGAIK